MSYPYLVTNKNDTDVIKMIYVRSNPGSMKKPELNKAKVLLNKIRRVNNVWNVPAGSVVHPKTYKFIFSPERNVSYSESVEGDRYRYIDGTVINFYKIRNRRFLGTINSWDITHMVDICGRSFGSIVEEAMERVGLEELDNVTAIVSHPDLHYTVKRCEILVLDTMKLYTEDGEAELEREEESDSFIEISGSIRLCQGQMKPIYSTMYSDKIRFKVKGDVSASMDAMTTHWLESNPTITDFIDVEAIRAKWVKKPLEKVNESIKVKPLEKVDESTDTNVQDE